MHLDLLTLVCCPICKSDLKIIDKEAKNQNSIIFGKLECVNCKSSFPIKEGIPILIEESQSQKAEKDERDKLARGVLDSSQEELLNIVSRHHHISVMKRRAMFFASKFNAQDIICDIGIGWGWHWIGIEQPNILGVDFSFHSLQIAKKLLVEQIDKNVHLICANVSNLPIKNKIIDGVWSVQSMQHLPPYDLKIAFTKIKEALKEYRLEIYWVNYGALMRSLLKVLGKPYAKIQLMPYYYRKVNKKELIEILEESLGISKSNIKISYNEMLFNPDLKIAHNFNIYLLDDFLGKIPFINSFLGRQIIAKINV